MGGPPTECIMRTFLIATGKRDKKLYPNSSSFTYDLPLVLHNVVGIAVRDFKFANESLINENNKTLSMVAGSVSSSVVLTTGTFNNNINDVITELNSKLTSTYKLTFSIDPSTGRVKVVYTGTSYVIIKTSPILRILGFDDGVSLCLYVAGQAPSPVPGGTAIYLANVVAPNAHDCYNLSEMVIRIKDVETIFSNDAVTDRCTAVLFNSNSSVYTIKQCTDHFIPLLQPQSRLQSLKIQLLNMEGDLYDTVNNEAVFLLEFYCLPKNDGICA